MSKITGPDFIGLQVRNVEASAKFYEDVVGLVRAPLEVPGAAVFATEPIPFAVRTAQVDLDAVDHLGWGTAIWFRSNDADASYTRLKEQDVTIAVEPFDGPFGRTFIFVDLDGYMITVHDKA
jgi:predicted enzyme related to lactoylglutathione lyase